jgi:hypothetical protein
MGKIEPCVLVTPSDVRRATGRYLGMQPTGVVELRDENEDQKPFVCVVSNRAVWSDFTENDVVLQCCNADVAELETGFSKMGTAHCEQRRHEDAHCRDGDFDLCLALPLSHSTLGVDRRDESEAGLFDLAETPPVPHLGQLADDRFASSGCNMPWSEERCPSNRSEERVPSKGSEDLSALAQEAAAVSDMVRQRAQAALAEVGIGELTPISRPSTPCATLRRGTATS